MSKDEDLIKKLEQNENLLGESTRKFFENKLVKRKIASQLW